MATQFYETLPKLRLVLHVPYLVSVNSMYNYGKHGVYKTADTHKLQNAIAEQIRKIDRTKYPWLTNNNYFEADYKFVLKSNYGGRDVTNLLKASEDGICAALNINDNRMVRVTSQKFDNADVTEELVIFTLTPYVGVLDIFKLTDSVNTDIRSAEEELLGEYKRMYKILTDNYPECGNLYISLNKFTELFGDTDVKMALTAFKNFGSLVHVVRPRNGAKYIRMDGPEGTKLNIEDDQVQEKFLLGYSFNNYNNIESA